MSRVSSRRQMIGGRPGVGRGSLTVPNARVAGPAGSWSGMRGAMDQPGGGKPDARQPNSEKPGGAPEAQRRGRRRRGPTTAGRGANGIRAGRRRDGRAEPGTKICRKCGGRMHAGGLDLAEVRFVPRVALRQLQGKGHGAVAAVQGTPEANPRPGRGAAAATSRPLRSHTRAGAARSAANRGPHRNGADTTAPPLPPGPAPVRRIGDRGRR